MTEENKTEELGSIYIATLATIASNHDLFKNDLITKEEYCQYIDDAFEILGKSTARLGSAFWL